MTKPFSHFPSPLAGEGGAERRMRGWLRVAYINPSTAPAGHLLPQGEKEDIS